MPRSQSPHHHKSSSSHHRHKSPSSSHAAAPHVSRSGKPLSALNASSALSASALLQASAEASQELDRILRGDESHAKRRERSRGRAGKEERRKLHKEVLKEIPGEIGRSTEDEQDPFLVHTAAATATLALTPQHQHRSGSKHRSKSKTRGEYDAAEALRHSLSKQHRVSSSSEHKSRHRSKSREKVSSSASKHRSSHHRHPSSSHTQSHSVLPRTRSRSHSRNRYPNGIATSPFHTVSGDIDHELQNRFVKGFESNLASTTGVRLRSPERHLSEARLAYEARLHRTGNGPVGDAELAEMLEREHLYDMEQQARRELARNRELNYLRQQPLSRFSNTYNGEIGRAAPWSLHDEQLNAEAEQKRREEYERFLHDHEDEVTFDLDGELRNDMNKLMNGSGSNGHVISSNGGGAKILTCTSCSCRYSSLNSISGDNSTVPRYLLCGHTFCTGCLEKLCQKENELELTQSTGPTTGSDATKEKATTSLAPSITLRCPTCASHTPLSSHDSLCLPINTSYLKVAEFLRARKSAGYGLKDTGVGRGDEVAEEQAMNEMTREVEREAVATNGVTSTPQLPCQQCSVHISTLYCQSCHIRYCSACSHATHVGRAMSEHVKRGMVVPVGVAKARGWLDGGNHNSSSATQCPLHSDQSLTLYCRTCSIPVCRDCVTPLFKGGHLPPGHDVDLLSTVLTTTQNELKSGVTAIESSLSKLTRQILLAEKAAQQVDARKQEVRAELKEAFTLVRTQMLHALAEREAKLEAELILKSRAKENRIHSYRGILASHFVSTRAAHESAVRVLGGATAEEPAGDIFAIRALMDVRAAIGANGNVPPLESVTTVTTTGGSPSSSSHPHDILLRVKPRDLIRHMSSSISTHGGLIASVPLEPLLTSIVASGTSITLSWQPGSEPAEGEHVEYVLEVCQVDTRLWKQKMKQGMQPVAADGAILVEDLETDTEAKWDSTLDSSSTLPANSRAAVNWLSVQPGAVSLGVGSSELTWKDASATSSSWTGITSAWSVIYSGELCTFKHDALHINSSYIYRLTAKNDLGSSGLTYSQPCTLPCMQLSYMSDMDSNGLITYLGSYGGVERTWMNPVMNNLLDISASSISVGDCSSLTSRTASTFQTMNRHLSWIRFDLTKGQPFRILLTHYTLANCGRGVGVRRVLRNWCLQGSMNATDWVTLREHVKDASLTAVPLATATWSITPPTQEAYRYLRILQTDVNHANDHHLALGQIEFYGYIVRD